MPQSPPWDSFNLAIRIAQHSPIPKDPVFTLTYSLNIPIKSWSLPEEERVAVPL